MDSHEKGRATLTEKKDMECATEMPLVTINIVTRNRRDALKRAIESAYAQTYRPIELVVVDNDSSDGSVEMVERDFPDVKVIRLHRNIGCQPGRNIGMKNSRGKYIFNLDDDGVLEPHATEKMVARFEDEEDVVLVAAAIEPLVPERSHLIRQVRCTTERYIGNFPGGASGIRRSVLDDAGYFPEYVRGHAEADLALRIIDKGYEMVYLPDAIMYHDVSDIERNKNTVAYYGIWHRLETAYRLEPWGRCLINGPWKALMDFVRAVREGSLAGYFRGVFRFLHNLPDILARRKPVSKWATQKVDFLNYNYVTDGQRSRSFRRYPLRRVVWDRLRKRHLLSAPEADAAAVIESSE